ncbi:MAG: [LysW]-lysine hydrolase [Chloroflexota bacterium]
MSINDDHATDLLEALLSIQSPTGSEDGVASLLLTVMERAGFEARRDEVGNAIGTWGTGERSVVLLGHMDTVSGDVPVRRLDGKLYGRGAVDAKGPLAAALVAGVRAAARANISITVIGAVQEEGPSVGARHLIGRPPPSSLIICEPSSWDAIVMGYKGSQRFSVDISQPGAHTAGPDATAPERAVEFWNRLVSWCDEQGGTGEHRASFNRLTPTLIRMGSESTGTLDSAHLEIGLRLPPGMTVEAARDGVESLLPGVDFKFSPGEPAIRGDKSNALVAAFLRSIREGGGTPRFKVKTGTSDMNVVGPAWQCPMVAYGPGDSRLDHTPDEHVRIEEYLQAIRVLTRVLEEL